MKGTGSRLADPRLIGVAWAALSLANVAAIAAWPSTDTIVFHLMAIAFAVLFGLGIWRAGPVLWGFGIVLITTITGIGLDVLHEAQQVEEVSEMPLMGAMFVAIVWHANRRITADHERHLVGEENARLLAAQRRFLQDASHHLRTPVTIALTHAELLARGLTDPEDQQDAQVVIAEMVRLRRLSERLLVIAAAGDPDFLHLEPVALDEFAIDALQRWRQTARRRLRFGRLDAATVRADAERLGLAVDALLENAVKHTSEDDTIEMSVMRGAGGTVRMIVRDTGNGIPASELPHVFDRFRTGNNGAKTGAGRSARGTGLGLALVRAVANAHGGQVQVRSAPGEGTEFEIVLPLAIEAELDQPVHDRYGSLERRPQ